MKKSLLIVFAAVLLSGCVKGSLTHNIDEQGNLYFVKTVQSPILDESKKSSPEESCSKELEKWELSILEKSCKVVDGPEMEIKNDKGEVKKVPSTILTSSGKYEIEGGNFMKKDGYILFNAKEMNEMLAKQGGSKNTPESNATKEMGKLGVVFEYKLNLAGIPVNYEKTDKMNLMQITSDKDFYFISKLENGRNNPFLDKMTKENSRNIESLKYFPSTEKMATHYSETVNQDTGKMEGEFLTTEEHSNRQTKKSKNIEKNPTNKNNQTLPSTGEPSIIQKVLDSVFNFFAKLF